MTVVGRLDRRLLLLLKLALALALWGPEMIASSRKYPLRG